MYQLTVEITFQASHSLRLSDSTSEPMHQHDWRLQAVVQADQLDADGLVMDFITLRELLHQAVAPLQRPSTLNDAPCLAGANPTTERLARYLYDRLADSLPASVQLARVILWEAPGCSCAYHPDKL